MISRHTCIDIRNYLLNGWNTYCKLINLSCQYTYVKFKIFCIYTLYCGCRCGYPDPTYLDRVLEELEDKGVTEESADDPEEYKEYTEHIQKKLNTCRVNWSWVDQLCYAVNSMILGTSIHMSYVKLEVNIVLDVHTEELIAWKRPIYWNRPQFGRTRSQA